MATRSALKGTKASPFIPTSSEDVAEAHRLGALLMENLLDDAAEREVFLSALGKPLPPSPRREGLSTATSARHLAELNATKSYVDAWNRSDCKDFVARLAKDATYCSDREPGELMGKVAITNYLRDAMRGQADGASAVRAVIGACSAVYRRSPCVCLYRGDSNRMFAAVLIEVADGKVVCMHHCRPSTLGARRQEV